MQVSGSSERYTYRPGEVPGQQDWGARENYRRAQELSSTASTVGDFFQRADNGPNDLDGRSGYVRIKEVEAPNLLEKATTTVSGFRTPDGDLHVTGGNQGYASTSLAISGQGREVSVDRPAFLNNRYLPSLENLTYNLDGSNSYEVAYYTPKP